MAIGSEFKIGTMNNITNIQKNIIDESYSIDSNVKWFTTLIMASIAGVVSYRDMIGAGSLSFGLVFASVLFVVALLFLIISLTIAQYNKNKLDKEIYNILMQISNFEIDKEISPVDAEQSITEEFDRLNIKYQSLFSEPKLFQILAIGIFATAVIVAFLNIMSTEIILLFK